MCDRGEVVFNLEGGRSCCEPLGLSFSHHDSVPSQRKRRSYRGDQCLGVMYMKASDWLRYNQKRVKAKHNGHLLVYPEHYLSKPGTIFF